METLNDWTTGFWGIFGILALFILYLLPTIVAQARHHRNTGAILILNLLTGWIVLGWIVSLVWSMTANVVNRPKSTSGPHTLE